MLVEADHKGLLVSTSFLQAYGIAFGEIMELENIGVLQTGGAGINITHRSVSQSEFLFGRPVHNRTLVVRADDAKKTFVLHGYRLTKRGQELLRIGEFIANDEYLEMVAQNIKAQGFRVFIGNFRKINEHKFDSYDEKEI
jgi:hypothetical protein